MNEALYDILESCLTELENGAQVESLLARYPAYAEELRPILIAVLEAKKMSAPEPSREAVVRGRARLMQRVSAIREEKTAPRRWVSPFFFRKLAVSLVLTLTLALSGTGLVGASSSALPGQNLYPVKRRWENVRLFFTFDAAEKLLLEQEFKHEREHEANELLSEGEQYEVEFSGVLTNVNGITYISTLPVVFPSGLQIPADGTALEVKGWTTDKGYVEIIEFEVSDENISPPGENNDSGEGNKDGGNEVNSAPSFETPEHKSPESTNLTEAPEGGSGQPDGNNGEVIPTPAGVPGESGNSSETQSKDGESESDSDSDSESPSP
jgi:hypothetical protein